MIEMIHNPLITSQTLETNNINIINSNYNNIYILTLKEQIDDIDESIYYYNIDKELYNRMCNNFILIKAPLTLVTNFTHYSKITILSKNVIEKFNVYNYQLQDKNLVLIMLNISCENIKLYLLQYENTDSLIEIYKTVTINKYFNIDFENTTILEALKKNILNMNESDYWTNKNNCNYNISKVFKKRKLNYHYLKNINIEFENYLKDILKNTNYIDPSRILTKNQYKDHVNTNNIFTKEDINILIKELPEKEKFLLFCNLIISKNYAHLAINNKELLIFMKPTINKFIQLFRYLFGYAWARFYIEESIKKYNVKPTDQFIFDIDTASELPIFPFSMLTPKMNPYCTIFVNDTILNSEYNLGGIIDYKESTFNNTRNDNYKLFNNNGIANLDKFKTNLNVFLTGNPTKNILENIEWEKLNIALSGSVICACIQKHHPLIDLFSNYSEDKRLKRYYNEYYANADVDIMFLETNDIIFMDKVKEFYNQIVINICTLNPGANVENINLTCNKYVYLFVTTNDIMAIIAKNEEVTYDKIINNLEVPEIRNLFVDLLTEELEKYKNNFFSKLSEDELKKYSMHYTDYIDFNFDSNNYRIRLACKKRNENGISIIYKYKIQSLYLDFPFELFMINKKSFMTTVQQFHLPCVRSYYDGTNVYLAPSCIIAHLTYMNIDYKYFSGAKNPSEIINKYRIRSFGTWLNENEKVIFIKYIAENQNLNNLYCINLNNINSIISNLGPLKIDHKIFRPRLFNPDDFIDSPPIDIQLGYFNNLNVINNNKIETPHDYVIELNERYDNQHNNKLLCLILEKLQTINEDGSINPVEKWVIEASWNVLNIKDNTQKPKQEALKYKYIK